MRRKLKGNKRNTKEQSHVRLHFPQTRSIGMFLFFCFLINSSPVVCLHVIGIYFAELEEARPVEYRLIPNKTIFNTPIYEQGMAGMNPTTKIFQKRKKRKNRREINILTKFRIGPLKRNQFIRASNEPNLADIINSTINYSAQPMRKHTRKQGKEVILTTAEASNLGSPVFPSHQVHIINYTSSRFIIYVKLAQIEHGTILVGMGVDVL